jgi:hypothetical protein
MDFLTQAIADLAALVTFQQRRLPTLPRNAGDAADETERRLQSLTWHSPGTGMAEDRDLTDV